MPKTFCWPLLKLGMLMTRVKKNKLILSNFFSDCPIYVMDYCNRAILPEKVIVSKIKYILFYI